MKLFSRDHFRASLKHYLFGRAFQAALSLIFTLLAIRVMQPIDYGIYLILTGLTDLLRPLSSLGVLPTVQRFLPEMAIHATLKQLQRFVRAAKYIRWFLLSTLTLILYFFWYQILQFAGIEYFSERTAVLVCVMICVILALEYSEATLEAILDQRSAQLARVSHISIKLIGLVSIAYADAITVERVLICEIIAATISLILSEILLANRVRLLQPDGSKFFTNQELLAYGAHLSFTQVIYAFATPGVLRILIARQLGVEIAGQFGFMQTLLQQMSRLMPSLLLANLISPMLIAARARGQLTKVSDACGLLFKTNVILVWPIIPIMLLAGDQIMHVVSGGRLIQAGLAMSFLIMGLSAMTQMQVATTVLQVHRMSEKLVWIGSLFLLVPPFVYLGAEYSLALTCFGFYAATAIRYLVAMMTIQSSDAKVRLDTRGSTRYLLALCIAFLIGLLVVSFSVWAGLATFILVFLVIVPFTKPISAVEAEVFFDAIRRRLPLARWIVAK